MKTKILYLFIAVLGLTLTNLNAQNQSTTYHTEEVDGVDIFYREAGDPSAPALVLLHGYPTSSHMFRNLIEDLSDDYYLIAPDFPGFGRSQQPSMDQFDYTFENYAKVIKKFLDQKGIANFSLYLMDYGAPVGFRIASTYPQQIETLIIQNGNAYEEGLRDFWIPIKKYWNDYTIENGKPLQVFHSPDGLKWQYTHGTRDSTAISPDNWNIDLQHLTREENDKIQLALFYDYRTNVPLYPQWQEYFRTYQPPTIIVWGKNDYIFPADGAYPYKRDLKDLEFHLLDTGHFA